MTGSELHLEGEVREGLATPVGAPAEPCGCVRFPHGSPGGSPSIDIPITLVVRIAGTAKPEYKCGVGND